MPDDDDGDWHPEVAVAVALAVVLAEVLLGALVWWWWHR